MHREVAATVEQGVAQGRDEDAGAAQALQGAGQAVAVGADVDGLEGEVAAPEDGEGVDHMAGLRERERARTRPDPHVLEHAVSVPLRRGDVEARGNAVTGS